ncbi:hypothetical protein LY78DRAFT_711251, partial [Colletotrichum sublineola]
LNKPITLRFKTFKTVVFAFSVLVVTYTIQDGKSSYLKGAILLSLYVIIVVAFYVSPIDTLINRTEAIGNMFASI